LSKNNIHYIYQRYFLKVPLTRKNLDKDSKSHIYQSSRINRISTLFNRAWAPIEKAFRLIGFD